MHSDLIEVYKMINKLSNVNFDNFSEFNTNRSTRDHSLKLKKRFNTELRQHFFTDKIIKLTRQTNCVIYITELFQEWT